jgi:rod shape-determining protein MreC
MQKLISTKLFRVSIVATLFLLLVFLNPVSLFNPIRSGFFLVLSPFQKFFYSVAIYFENTKEFLGSIGDLKSKNEKLIMYNQNLLAENSMLKDIKNENDNLREQLKLLPRDRFELLAASVISQDPNGTDNWIGIDKGSNDGIAIGMPVIVSNGILLGKVASVGLKNSEIMLLTNSKSTVNVVTIENGTKGIVRGKYGLGIIFDMVLQTDVINIGDTVVTSGIGGELPRGLHIGTVQEIHQSEDYLFQQSVLASPVQVSKLQMIFIIKDSK